MISLNKNARADDLSVRMPLRLFTHGDVLVDATGEEGWIEFWAEDAVAIKARLKAVTGRMYRIQLRTSQRTPRQLEAMSDGALTKELDEMRGFTVESLAIRTKAWRLLDTDGVHQDVPVTMENARELFGDDAHDLVAVCSEWLETNKDAFLPKKKPSS